MVDKSDGGSSCGWVMVATVGEVVNNGNGSGHLMGWRTREGVVCAAPLPQSEENLSKVTDKI